MNTFMKLQKENRHLSWQKNKYYIQIHFPMNCNAGPNPSQTIRNINPLRKKVSILQIYTVLILLMGSRPTWPKLEDMQLSQYVQEERISPPLAHANMCYYIHVHLFWLWSCGGIKTTSLFFFIYSLKKSIFFQATPNATHIAGNKVGGNVEVTGHQRNQRHLFHIATVPLYLTLQRTEHHC